MIRERPFGDRARREREPIRILLLEDDPDFAELVHAQLRRMPLVECRLDIASRLSEALGRLANEAYGLVLADLNLPDSSGLGTLEALVQDARPPVIVLTGDGDPALRARSLECGAYDFLAKDGLTAAALEQLVRLAAIHAGMLRTLRGTQARFQQLLNLSSDWLWEQDEEFRYTRFEGRVDELLASDSRSVLGMRRWEIPTNQPVTGIWDDHRAMLEAHLPFRDFQTRRLGDDGKLHYVTASGEPRFDAQGTFAGYYGVASDITQRKGAEDALMRSEARFRSLNALSSDWYWEQDAQFRLTYMSSIEKTGLDARAYLGLKRWDQPALNLTETDWAQHRAALERHESFRDFELQRPAAGGDTVWISLSGEPVFDGEERFTGYRGIGRDITARKRNEQKALRLSRMYAALGAANEAILRAKSPQEVFDRACQIAVEAVGFLLGSVYLLNTLSRSLARQAASGPAAAIAETLTPSIDASAPGGRGLIGIACRTGAPAISNDYEMDRQSEGRPAHVRSYSVGSAAVLPLYVEGALVGVFGLQHGERNAFDDELLSLLKRLADDIAFALENFRQEARRVKAEQDLRESEARFRSLAALSSDMYWEQDSEFRFTVVSGTSPKWLESGRARMIGRQRWDQHYFNMTEADWAVHKATLQARRPFRDLELGRTNEAGEKVWVIVSGEPVFDQSGTFQGYRGVGKDITARKREERLLRLEHETSRRLAIGGSPAEAVRGVLQAVCASEGWKCGRFFRRDDAAGVMRFDEAASYHEAGFESLIAGSRGLEFAPGAGLVGDVWQSRTSLWVADTSRDPRVKWALSREKRLHGALVFPVLAQGEVIGVISMSNDRILEPDLRLQGALDLIGNVLGQFLQRKSAESLLQQSEAWFRQTFELAGSGMAHVDLGGRFLRVNRRLCEILGYSEAELVGLSVKEISHPEDRDITDGERARMRAAELETVRVEKRYLRRNGTTVWVDLTLALARDANGKPLYEISIVEDITQRKASEAALRESEARFRSLTDLSADFYWETDAQHRVLRTTHGTTHRPINARGSRIGKARWEIPSTRPDAAGWATHRMTLDAHLPFRDFELARIDEEGIERHLSISGEPVFDAAGVFLGYRGLGKEITARKREEAILALEHEVTRRLAEAHSTDAGLKAIIRAVCDSQGWPAGRYFAVDEEAGVLRFSEAWGQSTPAVERFIAKSRELVYQPGHGLSGRVWQSGQALWVRDVSKDTRASGSSHAALQGGAFVFPVTGSDAVMGVMSFSSADVRAPDERMLQAVRVIGSQVGQFLLRKQAERKQRRRAEDLQRFRAAMDMSLDAIYLTDRASMRFVDVNKIGCKWLGYTRERLLKMGPQDVLGTSREQLEREYDAVIAEGSQGVRVETSYRGKDGRHGWTELHRRALRSGDRWIIVTISRDITERKRSEQRQSAHVRYQERIARFGQSALAKREPAELLEHAVQTMLEALGADAVAYLEAGADESQVMVRALVGVSGHSAGSIACSGDDPVVQVLRTGVRALVRGEQLQPAWVRALAGVALIPVRGDGATRGVLCVGYRDADAFVPEILNFVDATASVLSTALQRIDSEGRLAFLAQFDPLTGLPNRALLADRFTQTIVQAKRHDRPVAVLFIDLDSFKMVNDTLGHAGGDALLKETAVRLQSAVRVGDTVARISGDEFAIVLADLARPEDAAIVAQKVIDRLAAAVEIQGKEVFITASIGIAAFPADGADAETLIGAADAAMYRAKQAGRNAYQFFTAEINRRTRAQAQMASELRRAVEREEFALVYQPKYTLHDRRPSGAEALIRWKHPERGIVSPVEFIPVLEETGLIIPVGEWVIRRACEDIKAWQTAGLRVGPVSVNLSARQFRLQDLDARIRSLVASAGVDPGLIELEITESQLMQDPDHAIRVMRAMREAGMRIAIDDFGTGYSSLSYLRRFPVSSLKIDRSFVKDMSTNQGDATIVRTIIEMAHTLGFTVIAEGVESEEQAAFLRLSRCEEAQGYLFARPMPAEEFLQFCAAWSAGEGPGRP